MSEAQTEELEDREIGPVAVLFGEGGGKYPDGNSLLVRGSRESVLVDPALGVERRSAALGRVDRVFYSHCHEDHFASGHLFPEAAWHCHRADAQGFESLEHLLEIYGYPEEISDSFRKILVDRYHYVPHAVEPFDDGDAFDLGGVTIRVVHTPGHTRGHSCFVVQWGAGGPEERLVYLGDIELTSFGPYYGDAWSDLESFERSLDLVRSLEAKWYATFHHIGVLEREAFLERLDRFETKILERESRLLEYLDAPRTLDEVASHRFVYRPGDAVFNAEWVERRSMGMHIERLVAQDRVEEVEPGRFQRAER